MKSRLTFIRNREWMISIEYKNIYWEAYFGGWSDVCIFNSCAIIRARVNKVIMALSVLISLKSFYFAISFWCMKIPIKD